MKIQSKNLLARLPICLFISSIFLLQSPQTLAQTDAPVYQPRAQMEYVKLCDPPTECKQFSRLVMGTDHLIQAKWSSADEAPLSAEAVNQLLDEALKLGINVFDTSPIYVGGVENQLGKWLKTRSAWIPKSEAYYRRADNPDREVYIISKGGFPFDLYWSKELGPGTHSASLRAALQQGGMLSAATALDPTGVTPLQNVLPGTYASRLYGSQAQIQTRILEELQRTQRNLGKQVDLYLMHRDDGDFVNFKEVPRPKTAVKTIMSALSESPLRQSYHSIGWSNWSTERISESLQLAQLNPQLKRPLLNSPYFSLFEMSQRTIHAGGVQVTHADMMNPQFQSGIKIMSYSPLGGFSIFDRPGPAWKNAQEIAKAAAEQGDPYWQNVSAAVFTAENASRYQRLKHFTQVFNQKHYSQFTLDQMANAYVLAHVRSDFLTIGPRSIAQLRRTVEALELAKQLSVKDLDDLHDSL